MYVGAILSAFLKDDRTVAERKQGMIFPESHVKAWMVSGTPLTYDDITGDNRLSAKLLYSESFTFRISTVLRATGSFFMCHSYRIEWVSD